MVEKDGVGLRMTVFGKEGWHLSDNDGTWTDRAGVWWRMAVCGRDRQAGVFVTGWLTGSAPECP